jgi:hypothetical protein
VAAGSLKVNSLGQRMATSGRGMAASSQSPRFCLRKPALAGNLVAGPGAPRCLGDFPLP